MPELPEVQTVITYLKPKVINHTIQNVDVYYPKLLKNSSFEEFKSFLKNETFTDIERRGKFIIFHLTHNKTFVVHLRMEGKLFAQPLDSEPNLPQLLAEIYLDNCVLRYYDTRKFGTFEILYSSNPTELKSVKKLAMDAIDDKFTPDYLFDQVKHSSGKIKNVLLDQSVVAGLGNIYVNEVLFASNIMPDRIAKTLSYEDCVNLVKYSKEILNQSIKHNGTTIHSFKVNDFTTGGYQDFLQVHGKKKQKCPKCGNPIQFGKVNGRGTYYCPHCQK